MVKFSLRRLVIGTKYHKLTSEEELGIGLDIPDPGINMENFTKADNKMLMKTNLLLNNQLNDKLSQTQPLKKITNNLANKDKCDSKCKVINKDNLKAVDKSFVNIGFVDQRTESSSWYQPHMTRDMAVDVMTNCPVGTFIVRNSTSHSSFGCLAITLKVPTRFYASGIVHYLIVISDVGFRIKGFTKVFKSLNELVVHYSIMKENLPCRLIYNQDDVSSDRDIDFVDLESDPEFPELVIRLAKQLSNPFL